MNIQLQTLDWCIIALFFSVTVLIGVTVSKRAGRNEEEFFLGGRGMPWWLLGFSMVATTFSTDTPNLVTDIVRTDGVFGNWVWWCFLPSGMLTAFLYARLWRRLGVVTDLEFYELRYNGRAAAFLRGFRAVYLGLIFNVLIIANVSLAAIKIGGVMLGLQPWQSILFAMIATVIFTSLGGFRGVLITDFLLFIVAMTGSFGAAYFAIQQPEVGGLDGLIAHFQQDPALAQKLEINQAVSPEQWIAVFLIPISIVWWSAWYPGAEPGGGGYVVQRMLSAKNENHAVGATFFFNIAHYALRPWPWILVALASMVVYPELSDLKAHAGTSLPQSQIRNDIAYSLMLTKLPVGWIGLVLTGLIAAYMSTLSTQLNWGASYLVNDVWTRFIRPAATQKELVWMGRAFTVLLVIFSTFLALQLTNALQGFQLILSIGAGTGLLFLLRWFWWRINAMCEIVAMCASFIISTVFTLRGGNFGLDPWQIMVLSVALTTVCWLPFAWIGQGTALKTEKAFREKINPGGSWRKEAEPDAFQHPRQGIKRGILSALFATIAIYCALFAAGEFIYGRILRGTLEGLVCIVFSILTYAVWKFAAKKQMP